MTGHWKFDTYEATVACAARTSQRVTAGSWRLDLFARNRSLTCFDTWPKITTALVCSWPDCVRPGAKQYVIKSSGICCTQPLYKVSGNQRRQLAIQFGLEKPLCCGCCWCCCVYLRLRGLAALIHQSPVTFPFPPNCFIFYQAWCSVEDPPDMETINQCIAGCGEWDCFPDI